MNPRIARAHKALKLVAERVKPVQQEKRLDFNVLTPEELQRANAFFATIDTNKLSELSDEEYFEFGRWHRLIKSRQS